MRSNLYRKVLFTTTALVAISLASVAQAGDVVPAAGADTTINTSGSTDGFNFIAGNDNSFNTGNTTAVNMDSTATAEQIVTITGPAVTVTAADADTINITEDAAQITIGSGNTLSNTGTGDTIHFGAVDNSPAGFPAAININGNLLNSGGGQAIDAADVTGGTLNINLNNGGVLTGDVLLGLGTTNFVAANGSTFTGSITGTSAGGGGTDNITLGNGALANAINGGAGADTVTLTGGAHTNAISNVESLVLSNSGTTYANGTAITGLNTALTLGSGTTLTANNNITGSATALTLNGRLNVGTTNVVNLGTGSVTGTGTYGVNLNSTQASSITTNTGSAQNLSGLTVNVSRNTSQFIENGTTYTIFTNTGAGALTPTGTTAVDNDNSYVLGYNLSAGGTGGNDLILTAVRNTYNAAAAATGNHQTTNVGAALEAYGANNFGSNAQLDAVVLGLDNLASAGQVTEALETLTPNVIGVREASLDAQSKSLDVVSSRLGGSRGVNTGDEFRYIKGAWLQGFGTFNDQDRREGIDGYESNTWGAAVGFDTEKLWKGVLTGMTFAYSNTDVDSKASGNAQTDIDSYQVALYGSKTLSPAYNGIYIDGIAAFAYNQYDSSRTLFTNSVANGEYDGYQASARLAVGKDYNLGKSGLFFTPEASAQYTYLHLDGYTETGAGGAGLNVGDDNSNAFILGAGGKLAMNLDSRSGVRFVPEFRAKVLYDVIGDKVDTTNTFTGGGASFNTQGVDPAQLALNLGAGVKVLNLSDNLSVTADYDAQLKEDFIGHSVNARLRADF